MVLPEIPYAINIVLLSIGIPFVVVFVAPMLLAIFPGWREVWSWFGFSA